MHRTKGGAEGPALTDLPSGGRRVATLPGGDQPPRESRRRFLGGLAGTLALPGLIGSSGLHAQTAGAAAGAEGTEFSFDLLTQWMEDSARGDPLPVRQVEGFLAGLDYDDFQHITFRDDRARWGGEGAPGFRVNAFHLGWLYKEPVTLHEIVDGRARPMAFGTEDFDYHGLTDTLPKDFAMPGVSGFRLLAPFNRPDHFDEVTAFLGASYFRAVGRDTGYGLSARGLAVNTGHRDGEEFPRFTDFWLERPAPGAGRTVIYAALHSASVTGAYRFVITPGENTVIDVTARLFVRRDIGQLGIAPLTSMFLFDGSDPGPFDDFRPAVHDSQALVLNTTSGDTFYRPLNNPPRLAGSYLSMETPASFGLVQRARDFDDYQDAQARYERRPSLMIEPLGDWGKGVVRLIEIPSDLEGNDNIVAYWVPEREVRAGDQLEVAYRQHWGAEPPGDRSSQRARVLRTRAGKGGVSGVEGTSDRRKFVIDFEGGLLAELPGDAAVTPQVSALRGEIAETVLSRIPGTRIWRLVIEARGEAGQAIELKAAIEGYGQVLTETWIYQWVKE